MGLDFLDDSEHDYENALLKTKFGKFHLCLLTAVGLIYMNTAVGITILSFVLPAATCDYKMTSVDKGWLTASPMLGMLFGSYFWGCLADTKGRRIVLIATLIGDGLFGILSAFSPYFSLFVAIRFFNGFNIAGAMSICFPYLGEFQPTKYREKILCWMELFWTVGIIALPLIAWGIIPLKINLRYKDFFFHSWNLFVAICALPSLILGVWLIAFPESPKFHLEIGESEKALEILKHMYHVNTGEPADTYPVKSLKTNAKFSESEQRLHPEKSIRELRIGNPKEFRLLMREIWTQTKNLCKKPHLRNTALTCFIQFGLTSSYYTMMLWFPELMQRFETFEHAYPGKTSSVCAVSSIVLSANKTITAQKDVCDSAVDAQVFLHVLYIGLSCIPTSLWLPLCVHKLGVKFFLVFGLGFSAVVTMGLYFVRNSTENLILSCIFEALTSLTISVVYTVMVDLFPTNLRVMAAALSMTFGRLGALLGNLMFGFLIDLVCVVPIALFAALLLLSGVMCFLLPDTSTLGH